MKRSHDRRLFVAEALEPRTLFNGADGPLVISGTDGPDTIELYYGQLAGGNWTWNYNVNGVGKGLYDFDASNVVINAKGGNDKITLFSLPLRQLRSTAARATIKSTCPAFARSLT